MFKEAIKMWFEMFAALPLWLQLLWITGVVLSGLVPIAILPALAKFIFFM